MIVKTEKGEYVNLATAAMLRTAKHPSKSAKHDCCLVLEACYATSAGLVALELTFNYDPESASVIQEDVANAWVAGKAFLDILKIGDE